MGLSVRTLLSKRKEPPASHAALREALAANEREAQAVGRLAGSAQAAERELERARQAFAADPSEENYITAQQAVHTRYLCDATWKLLFAPAHHAADARALERLQAPLKSGLLELYGAMEGQLAEARNQNRKQAASLGVTEDSTESVTTRAIPDGMSKIQFWLSALDKGSLPLGKCKQAAKFCLGEE